MPITIGPGVNPSLLGQAGLAEGQGELARWTAEMQLKQQALNGRYPPQQQAPMVDNKVFDHGQWIDPHAQQQPQAQPAVDPLAQQQQLYDQASQQRVSDVQTKHQQIENSDYLTDEQKQYAHQQIDNEFALGAKYKPLQTQQSMDDFLKQNSTTLPDGSTIIRDGSGKITHVPPKQNGDMFPPPAEFAAQTVAETNGGQPTGQPTPEDMFKSSTYTAPDGTVYTQTKTGWKMLGKPPAPPKPVKDEISAHELADLELKYMKMTDSEGNPKYTDEEAQSKAVDVLKRHQALTGRSTQGSAKTGTSPIDHGAQQEHEDSLETVTSHEDYAKIPRGTPYKDADGNIRMKP